MTTEAPEIRLPVEGEYIRHVGRLVQIQDVTPPVTQVLDYIFEDTTATVIARSNGNELRRFGTFNNFYGENTCVEQAIEEARSRSILFGPGSVEIIVVKTTSRIRMRPNPHEKENFYAKGIRDMKQLDHGCKRDLPDDIEEIVFRITNPPKEAETLTSDN